jgi:protein tyrosine phosphatase
MCKTSSQDVRTDHCTSNTLADTTRYIATQGPLPETVVALWRMVWEKDCRVFVMVTGLREGGKHKCARYWPKALYNPELKVGDVQYGPVNVRIIAGEQEPTDLCCTALASC